MNKYYTNKLIIQPIHIYNNDNGTRLIEYLATAGRIKGKVESKIIIEITVLADISGYITISSKCTQTDYLFTLINDTYWCHTNIRNIVYKDVYDFIHTNKPLSKREYSINNTEFDKFINHIRSRSNEEILLSEVCI